MSQQHLNAIIIGGGVNGCGIARDLALRGLNVALIEQYDFGAGTTGQSSGMIHGGLRYILSEIETTKLSCLDSGYIQKIIPHLLFRIPFIMPIKSSSDSKMRDIYNALYLKGSEIAFEVYDRYQPLKRGKPSTKLTAEEAYKIEPGLSRDLLGAVTMDEWGIDSYRLCLANALDAYENRAQIYTHTRVIELIRKGEEIVGVKAQDLLTGKRFELRADAVFNAAGPWVERMAGLANVSVKIRPSKGIHLWYPRRIGNAAIVCEAVDGRQVFIMPHENNTMIGTTDDDYYGSPDDIPVLQDEVEYLLQAVERYYPSIRKHRISYTTAGIRPTLYEYGKYEDYLTRSHAIYDHSAEKASGFYTIAGGKLASYRVMSEEAADIICKALHIDSPCKTHLQPLPGGDYTPDVFELSREYEIDPIIVSRIVYRHGSRALKVLDIIKEEPRSAAFVCQCEPVTEAELRYIIREELVRRLDDLKRRCKLGLGICNGMNCARRAAEIFAEEKKLSPEEMETELEHFRAQRFKERASVMNRRNLAQEELHAHLLG